MAGRSNLVCVVGLMLAAALTAAPDRARAGTPASDNDALVPIDPARPPVVTQRPDARVGALFPDGWSSWDSQGLSGWQIGRAGGALQLVSPTVEGLQLASLLLGEGTGPIGPVLNLEVTATIDPQSTGTYQFGAGFLAFPTQIPSSAQPATASAAIITTIVNGQRVTWLSLNLASGGSSSTSNLVEIALEEGGVAIDPTGQTVALRVAILADRRTVSSEVRFTAGPQQGLRFNGTASVPAGAQLNEAVYEPILRMAVGGDFGQSASTTSTLSIEWLGVASTSTAPGAYLADGGLALVDSTGRHTDYPLVAAIATGGQVFVLGTREGRLPFDTLEGLAVALVHIPGAPSSTVYSVVDEATFTRDILPLLPPGSQVVGYFTDAFTVTPAGATFGPAAPRAPTLRGGGCVASTAARSPAWSAALLSVLALLVVLARTFYLRRQTRGGFIRGRRSSV